MGIAENNARVNKCFELRRLIKCNCDFHYFKN